MGVPPSGICPDAEGRQGFDPDAEGRQGSGFSLQARLPMAGPRFAAGFPLQSLTQSIRPIAITLNQPTFLVLSFINPYLHK